MLEGETVAERLASCSNRPAGFDYMRLFLALAVVCSHTTNVTYGMIATEGAWRSAWRPLLAIILPLFFCLSGFLVAGSLERCKTLVSFLGLRLLRLVPALAVDTTLAALVIGPTFTTLSLRDYFTDSLLHSYFLNILGDPHFFLPGVFMQIPLTGIVNGQLWTLPWELFCYASLGGLAFFGITRNRWAVLACVMTVTLAYAAWFGVYLQTPHPLSAAKGTLIESFLFGVVAYMFRDRIVLNGKLCLLCAIVMMAALWNVMGDYFIVLPVAYVTVYLGLLNPRRLKVIESGDYSYGIFLYGFPIQQATVAVIGPEPWWRALAVALPIIIGLAVFSWWCVEKPALRLRPYLYALENRLVGWSHAIPFGGFFMKPPVGPWLRRPPAREAP